MVPQVQNDLESGMNTHLKKYMIKWDKTKQHRRDNPRRIFSLKKSTPPRGNHLHAGLLREIHSLSFKTKGIHDCPQNIIKVEKLNPLFRQKNITSALPISRNKENL
ncbi:hypothetical protein KC19_3G092900 [Ceratodon purpureus]|uniref:Uncharacterized protein n=1 Tax=Ceratodon purpureus TaxID=3225 RepID=A0A8T0IJ05_CERPU|nr:hypothetical protein KC19_3G092900 [Ceratodon purpureus]